MDGYCDRPRTRSENRHPLHGLRSLSAVMMVCLCMSAAETAFAGRPPKCVVPMAACEPVSKSPVARLRDNPDSDIFKQQAWSLLKDKALSDEDIGIVLNHAFHLIALDSKPTSYWVFDRRTAPEFVYIVPRGYSLLRDGSVLHEQSWKIVGNGVEVHPTSSGRGPFAGPLSKDEEGEYNGDEFRLHYEVTYAPKMKWLEGYTNFLTLRLRENPPPSPPVTRPTLAHCCPQTQPCRTRCHAIPATVGCCDIRWCRKHVRRQRCRHKRVHSKRVCRK